MGRYVVEKRIGAGGMAEVFVARQVGAEGFTRRVALKRMSAALSEDPKFAEMFIAEARACALLQHPNIVAIHDFDRDETGALFLAMELVDGADLRRVGLAAERAGRPFPAPLAAFVVGEILRALAYAQDRSEGGVRLGLVHRDVSPHNVLVSRAGAVKLADFGIAKATAVSAASRSQAIRGKVAYMSPEQARGESVDGRSDLFSVGVLLYELLSGARPFEGASESEILAQLLRGRYVPLLERAPSAPRDLTALATRLLAEDRERRYPSASEALREALACSCYPADGPGELADFVRRILPAGLAPGTAAPEPYAGESRPSRSRARFEPTRRTLVVLSIGAALSVAAAVAVWVGDLPRRRGAAPPAAPTPAAPEPAPDAAPVAPVAATTPTPAPDAGMVDSRAPSPPDRPMPKVKRDRRQKGSKWDVDLKGRSPDEVPIEK